MLQTSGQLQAFILMKILSYGALAPICNSFTTEKALFLAQLLKLS